MHTPPIAHIADLMHPWLNEFQQKVDHSATPLGPVSGLRDLDRVLLGFLPGELTIIGGRAAMGKTSMVLNIASHVAVNQGLRVLVFSETAVSTLATRMVATIGSIQVRNLCTGGLTDVEWPALTATVEKLRSAQILLRAISHAEQPDFAEEANRVQRDCGPLDLVLIDSLTPHIDPLNSSHRILPTQRLKDLAIRLQIPVAATTLLSSYSSVEMSADKRPMPSDLGDVVESVERDADVIMFLHREQYYTGGSSENFGLTEVFVARNRNGPTATIKLGFSYGVAKFENLSAEQARYPCHWE